MKFSRAKFPFLLALALVFFPVVAQPGSIDEELLLKARNAQLYLDNEIAIETLLPLAEKGNSEAMFLLFSLYRNLNYDLSFKYLNAAVSEKNPQALSALGSAYLRGETRYKLKRDVDQALVLLEEASKLGSAAASSELARINKDGTVGQPNAEKSFKYAEISFNQRLSFSASALARYYRDGIGVKANVTKAYQLFSIDCYRNFLCSELDAITPLLTKEQEQIARASLVESLRTQEDYLTVLPLDLQPNWAEASRATLFREYSKLSPLYAQSQVKAMEQYSALNRAGRAHVLLLEIKGASTSKYIPTGFNWDAVLKHVTQRLVKIDQQRFAELNSIIESTGNLDSWMDQAISDKQLRYLVALYLSNAANRIGAAIQTANNFYVDSAKNMWVRALAADVSLQGASLSNYVADLRTAYVQQVPKRMQQLDAECSIKLYSLSERVGKRHQDTYTGLVSLPIMLVESRDTLLKFCVEGEYQFVDRVLEWEPVKQEIEILGKWTNAWESSQAYRNLQAKYEATLKQLIEEERERLKL